MTKLVLAGLLFIGACGDVHMGDGYGRRLRTALDAQRDGKGEGVAIDSADAKLVTTRYHNTPTQGQQGGQPAAALLVPTSGYGSSSTSSSMGVQPAGPPPGGIRLDAVK
jgi:hypothetical protein